MSDITRDMSFGGMLRWMRVDAKITLGDAARMLEMDAGSLSKLETSKLPPPDSRAGVIKICECLGISASEFLISQAFAFHVGKLHSRFFE